MRELVDGVRKVEAALGSQKKVHQAEQGIREWAHRSIVSLVDIPAGTIISQDMVWSKRPGTGIPSYRMEEVIGQVVTRDIRANTLIAWNDLAQESL